MRFGRIFEINERARIADMLEQNVTQLVGNGKRYLSRETDLPSQENRETPPVLDDHSMHGLRL